MKCLLHCGTVFVWLWCDEVVNEVAGLILSFEGKWKVKCCISYNYITNDCPNELLLFLLANSEFSLQHK